MQKPKKGEVGPLSKSERQKLQRLYTPDAAYGFVRNLASASNLSVSKVRQFLNSETSCTKFTSATRKFKRMKASASFKNEIWCTDLAFVDKLAKKRCKVFTSLSRLDRKSTVQRQETEDSKETVRAFSIRITKTKHPKKICFCKETEFRGEFIKIVKLKEYKFTLQ